MPLDWNSGALAEGLHCYRTGQFFAAHEHWESVWLACAEPEKTFLQALIQVTAAFHHLSRGNTIGAASLLAAAQRRLQPYPSDYAGLALDPLRASLSAWRQALDHGEASPSLPIPVVL